MNNARPGHLWINGKRRDFDDAVPQTLAALVEKLGLPPGRVVAEVDGEAVPSARFAETALADGARVELVHFVGGG